MKNTQVNPIFSWDEETGIASCILYNKANNKTYLGIAQCHTDDFDMMNEKTGCKGKNFARISQLATVATAARSAPPRRFSTIRYFRHLHIIIRIFKVNDENIDKNFGFYE